MSSTIDQGLRTAIAYVILDAAMVEYFDDAQKAADAVLAIPEIAEALRITRGEVDGIVTVREMTRDEITEKFGR